MGAMAHLNLPMGSVHDLINFAGGQKQRVSGRKSPQWGPGAKPQYGVWGWSPPKG